MTVYVIKSDSNNQVVYSNVSAIEQVDRDSDSSTYDLVESSFSPAIRVVVRSWEHMVVRW